MRTLWIALLLTNVIYYVFTIIAGRPDNVAPNDKLFLVLLAVGLLFVLLSFPIKNRSLTKATEQQSVGLVQSAYVVAWALCEVAALLGMMDFFLTSNHYYYGLFILSGVGQLIHFPRSEHLLNASFKSR